MSGGHDRGAFDTVQVQRCQRGFLISTGGGMGLMGYLYAFDRIEDAAAWLVEQYANFPEPEEKAEPAQC